MRTIKTYSKRGALYDALIRVETLGRTDELAAEPCHTLLPLNYCGL